MRRRENAVNHLIPTGTTGLLDALLFQCFTVDFIFPQPLEGNLEQGCSRWKLGSEGRFLGNGPWGRLSDEGTQTHVRNMSREIIEAIEDMCGIF